jgi:hypothetical protein
MSHAECHYAKSYYEVCFRHSVALLSVILPNVMASLDINLFDDKMKEIDINNHKTGQNTS